MHSAITTYHVGSFSVRVGKGQSHSDAWAAAMKRACQSKPVSPGDACQTAYGESHPGFENAVEVVMA